jgi:plastocyanin
VKSKTFVMPKAGRIVAVGGHLHGGSHELRLTHPGCGNRTIARSDPTYAVPGDPLYKVHPLLHEPDPKSISWSQWSDGSWAIGRGERLRVSAVYDDSRPHMRVMGIAHVYLAADSSVERGCAPAPTQEQVLGPDFDGRDAPPGVRLTLAQWRGGGKARLIDRPAGVFTRADGNAHVLVKNFSFDPPLVSIPRGATLRWSFRDRYIHDATVVRGPRGFATATVRNRDERHRFTVPGEYRLYCSIHPVQMSQVVKVR